MHPEIRVDSASWVKALPQILSYAMCILPEPVMLIIKSLKVMSAISSAFEDISGINTNSWTLMMPVLSHLLRVNLTSSAVLS